MTFLMDQIYYSVHAYFGPEKSNLHTVHKNTMTYFVFISKQHTINQAYWNNKQITYAETQVST
jgi:hypothetical protein